MNEEMPCQAPKERGIIDLMTETMQKAVERQQMLNEQILTIKENLGLSDELVKGSVSAESAEGREPQPGTLGKLNELMMELSLATDREERLIRTLKKL